MTKKELKATAEKMIGAPSCCAGLKEKAQKWIDSIGSAEEKSAAKEMIEEIEADITPIDGLVAFAHSEQAKKMFGAGAEGFAKHADELKKSGSMFCRFGNSRSQK